MEENKNIPTTEGEAIAPEAPVTDIPGTDAPSPDLTAGVPQQEQAGAKVMRYLRLNSLVPELLSKVDEKGLGFMPAVEISYIKPKNQRLIAVSIDGEQSSPSHAQAKRLRELDQAGKLNGDVIDGILSEKKKEDRGVIISMAELEKYFGKEVTPVKMKEQIMSLLDEWKEKQPPELKKPEKKADLEK